MFTHSLTRNLLLTQIREKKTKTKINLLISLEFFYLSLLGPTNLSWQNLNFIKKIKCQNLNHMLRP